MIDDTYMVGKISVKNHPFVEHFKFVKALEDENTVAKQTIPSPGQFYAYFTGAELLADTLAIYGTEEAFAEDVIKAYNEFVAEIYARQVVEIFSLMTVYGAEWSIQNLLLHLQEEAVRLLKSTRSLCLS